MLKTKRIYDRPSIDDATTRALSEGEGNAISASFEKNDEVVVVDADGSTIVGTLKAQSEGPTTTLTGTLDAKSLTAGEVVTLRYRSATANYDGQAGTLAGISASQDYAEGTLTVSTTSPLEFTSDNVTLSAKQSITKFSFTDGTSPVSVKTFGIAATGLVQSIAKSGVETVGAVTGTLAGASADVYIALRNNSGEKQTYSFTVKDNDGKWYTGTKKANLANGKNYATSVTLTQLPALTSSSDVGTIGVVDGFPAIVVEINSMKKAVALMNAGALCPEHYGAYYTFTNRTSELTGSWYVPTKDELEALAAIGTKVWGAQNGVNGCSFTIGGNTLFLPAAGYIDNDPYDGDSAPMLSYVSTYGYYWSSTSYNDDLAFILRFSNTTNNTATDYIINGLTVRPFHTLPSPATTRTATL
jgi:hypothetical protein